MMKTSVANPDPYVLGLPDPDPFVWGTDPAPYPAPDPFTIKQKYLELRKNLDSEL
jgi:hypothetical protein